MKAKFDSKIFAFLFCSIFLVSTIAAQEKSQATVFYELDTKEITATV